jgi:FKBP-type peptidyl-prolyl cis-trans isomerase (trigger factor)
MTSAIAGAGFPVTALLRQQTERQAQQAEQQAQALEQQAAAKRREARAAQQQARELDSEAAESANRANLLQQNLATADRLTESQQQRTERLNSALNRTEAPAQQDDTQPQTDSETQPKPTTTVSVSSNNAATPFSLIARPPAPSSGLSINVQV